MADHDQRLKVAVPEFLAEFVDLVLPTGWAGRFACSSAEWLTQEIFPDPPRGERRLLDLVARVSVTQPAESNDQVLLHVEIESRQGDKETRRQGDKETRRQGDKETRRQGDKETRRQGDKETRRQGDKETVLLLRSLSPCLPVSLSPCLPVSLSPCLPVSLSPCLLVYFETTTR